MSTLRVSFAKATDPRVPPELLKYQLYISQSAELGSLENINNFAWLEVEALDVSQLESGFSTPGTYFYNIVCRDLAGNAFINSIIPFHE